MSKYPADITGLKFGKLTVIKRNPDARGSQGESVWTCKCDCGKTIDVVRRSLTSANTMSCGCIKHPDLTGQKFNMLTVIGPDHKGPSGIVYWLCRCECGRTTILTTTLLKCKIVKSCGCLRHEYYTDEDKELGRRYTSMISRCYQPKQQHYNAYGGRGIKVCDEWLNDKWEFFKWAKENGFKPGLSLERKDVNGDYCPENCTWIPLSEQALNRRTSIIIDVDGVKKDLAEWARIAHLNYYVLYRIYQSRGLDGVADKLKQFIKIVPLIKGIYNV